MNALILKPDNSTYASPVLAIRGKGWGEKALIFDPSFSSVSWQKIWGPRTVFIVDYKEFEGKRGGWSGLPPVLSDGKLRRALRFGRRARVSDFPYLDQYALPPAIPERFEIRDEAGMKGLEYLTVGFHDATPRRIQPTDCGLELELDTSWGCYITLLFQDVTEVRGLDHLGMIYDSEMVREQDSIRWTVTNGYYGEEQPSVKCGRLFWTIKVLPFYQQGHRNYADLSQLYGDLSDIIADSCRVSLEDGRIVLENGAGDCLEIRESRTGDYEMCRNGIKEPEDVEDQDIYEYAVSFLTEE